MTWAPACQAVFTLHSSALSSEFAKSHSDSPFGPLTNPSTVIDILRINFRMVVAPVISCGERHKTYRQATASTAPHRRRMGRAGFDTRAHFRKGIYPHRRHRSRAHLVSLLNYGRPARPPRWGSVRPVAAPRHMI